MSTKPDRSTYTAIDFREWQAAGSLVLSPKFQRRGVWSTPARSYLIDTLLLEMPVPPIYIRVVQSPKMDKVVREVIDGQQRISAVLEYIEGKFALAKNIESPVSGRRFDDLDADAKRTILHYPIICAVFQGIDDPSVLSIFARLNTHSVKLNAQELRNGRWFGHFKQMCYRLAYQHLAVWRDNRIFSEAAIARMAEAELTSELVVLGMDGLQDKKKSIDTFYRDFDEEFPDRNNAAERFERTIDELLGACGEILSKTEFRRPPLFYSLYGVVYHRIFGVPGLELERRRGVTLTSKECSGLSSAVRDLSEMIVTAKTEDESAVPKKYQQFVGACLRQTDNLRPRRTRLETLYRKAFIG